MKDYLPWRQCLAETCAHQGRKGKIKLCLAPPRKRCPHKSKNNYGRHDIEDIICPP